VDGPTLTLFLVQISLVLAFPLFVAILLKKLSLSPLVVELLCGVVLGPSVFGVLAPQLYQGVFPTMGRATQAREAVTEIGLLIFVFLAGLEVQTGHLRKQGKAVIWTSALGIVIPFGLGMWAVLLWPGLWRAKSQHSLILLALFIATSLSISALPVIARILVDLNLIKTELGFIIMTTATVNDLIGWGLFAVILSNFGGEGHSGRNRWASLVVVLLVFGLILSLSNKRIQRAVAWLNLPKETLQLKLTFLVVTTAAIIAQVTGTHATLYFVSIGLRANFVASFDIVLVLVVLLLACAGKIGGVYLGGVLGGKTPRESLVVAFGLNARGAVGIVLTTVALEYKLIDQRVFVALIIMALATSVLSAMGIKHVLGKTTAGPAEKPELLPSLRPRGLISGFIPANTGS
jgi:Kef-type K+ transport system membrane component KefB